MKVTYPETGIYEHELKAIDKIKKVFDRGEKTKNWRAYAGFEFMHKNGKKAVAKGSSEKFEYEPYRVCRRPSFLRECPDEKSKIYP